METYIQFIILLLLIILLVDRFYGKGTSSKPTNKKSKPKKSNSIMGESKEVLKQQQTKKTIVDTSNKTINEKQTQKVISSEDLEAVFNSSPTENLDTSELELDKEEEELKTNISNEIDEDFNTGLSFEELQKIAKLLNQQELTNETLPVAMKIENTELLEILNEQIPKAQQHVSDLLNTHLANHNNPKSNDDWRDFDIGDFV